MNANDVLEMMCKGMGEVPAAIERSVPMDPRSLLPAVAVRAIAIERWISSDRWLPGTSQNPDSFCQCREAVEPFYVLFPQVLEATMERFGDLTGRRYRLFDYVGIRGPNGWSY